MVDADHDPDFDMESMRPTTAQQNVTQPPQLDQEQPIESQEAQGEGANLPKSRKKKRKRVKRDEA